MAGCGRAGRPHLCSSFWEYCFKYIFTEIILEIFVASQILQTFYWNCVTCWVIWGLGTYFQYLSPRLECRIWIYSFPEGFPHYWRIIFKCLVFSITEFLLEKKFLKKKFMAGVQECERPVYPVHGHLMLSVPRFMTWNLSFQKLCWLRYF